MTPILQAELKQGKPFASAGEEAFLNITRTQNVLAERLEVTIGKYGITPTQYNVLRILRGSPEGLCRNEIRDRLVTRTPDVSRLLARMEKQGLVRRARKAKDRRAVNTTLTDKGKKMAADLDEPIRQAHITNLGHMNASDLRTLNRLLEKARGLHRRSQ